jgi:hypothetical protein
MSGYGVEATEIVAALVGAGIDVSAVTSSGGQQHYMSFPVRCCECERVCT